METVHMEVADVPENLKGLIIGKGRSGLIDIGNKTGAKLSLNKTNQICVKGDKEQIQKAKAMIQNKLERRHSKKTFQIQKALIIGIKGDFKRIRVRSSTRISWKSIDDLTVEVTITGEPKNCDRAHGLIDEAIISANYSLLVKQYGGGKKFSCFVGEYTDAKFLLEEYKNPPKLNCFISGTPYRIKISSKNNFESLVEDSALLKIKEELSPALKSLHEQKDEKMLLVDLWCHYGAVLVHNVKEEEVIEEKEFTMENIVQRLISEDTQENSNFKERWKTLFEEGIRHEDVSIDDIPMDHFHKKWRYDYAFKTPLGQNVRFKSWEKCHVSENDGPSEEPSEEVKNLLIPVNVEGQENVLLSWLCYPSVTLIKGDLFVPSSKYDIRLKLRTGSRFVSEKSAERDVEDEILSEYLSHCEFDIVNHELNLPPDVIPLPEGFSCSFYRAAQEDFYSVQEDDQTFTVIFLDEKGWDSDTSEQRMHEQFGIRVVMDSWAKKLLSGNWEPQMIIDMLPQYMEFVGEFATLLKKT